MKALSNGIGIGAVPEAMDTVNDDTVYDRVMQYLFRSGAMQPGERVVETQLAARLGVSRIPVREALGRLRGQGLLVSDGRGRGLRLRQYSLDEIADFYDYRELLEGGAARAAARAASAADIDRLAVIHAQAVELGAAGRYESPEWYATDYGFHAALAEASHNERVTRAVKHLLAELHGVFYGPLHHRIAAARGRKLRRAEAARHAAVVIREHQAILAAVRAGDSALAERRARHHVGHAMRRIRRVMTNLDTERAGDLAVHG